MAMAHGKSGVHEAVERYAHLSDLTVVEQPTREMQERTSSIELKDFVHVATGSPMPVIPPTWASRDIGRQSLIG